MIVVAATNRPDMLDGALIRAGRIDRKVTNSLMRVAREADPMYVRCNGARVSVLLRSNEANCWSGTVFVCFIILFVSAVLCCTDWMHTDIRPATGRTIACADILNRTVAYALGIASDDFDECWNTVVASEVSEPQQQQQYYWCFQF